jgi:RNA polymerase subunit RPABC4/transcription elongation factor Spt4/cbb3-type cytochrome oxidase subunit 3
MKETFFKYLDNIQLFFQNIINDILTFDYITFFVDYFSNFNTEDFLKIVVIYLFLLWVAIIIWVTRDILARSNSIFFQLFCILLVVLLTPIFGLIIYFIIRPSYKKYEDEELYEEIYEELDDDEDSNRDKTENKIVSKVEEKIKEEEIVASFEKITCYNCHYHIEENFKFCPNCEIKLLDNCKKCSKEIKTNWKICPYC